MIADVTNIRCFLAKTVIQGVLKEVYTLEDIISKDEKLFLYSRLIAIGESGCMDNDDDIYCTAIRTNRLLTSQVTLSSTDTTNVPQTKDCDLSLTVNTIDIPNNIALDIQVINQIL